jgi:Ulp1 family protease
MQDNSCDCGVYVLQYAEEFCKKGAEISKKISTDDIKDRFKRYLGPTDFKPKTIRKKRNVSE